MLARVLHRDGLMLVIDKPAGMPVHRGPKGGGSLEDHFDALRYGLPRPPALAHRLDKDTSGCLVLGRHRKALAHLGLLFKHGKVGKTYWAVVEGRPGRRGRHHRHAAGAARREPRLVDEAGPQGPAIGDHLEGAGAERGCGGRRPADATAGRAPLTWLALTPVTGRTHQLRVHCAAMGWPIVGDNIYGTAPRFGGPVMHLHAREVTVPLSKNKAPVRVVAPVPPHMRERLAACGWNGADDRRRRRRPCCTLTLHDQRPA